MERKIGVIFNPSAGKGNDFPLIGRLIQEKFGSHAKIITGEGRFGKVFIPKADRVLPPKAEEFTEIVKRFVDEFVELNASLIVGVGGDGTLNLIASRLLEKNVSLPLMGIAAGTANVGPLLRFDLKELHLFNPDQTYVYKVVPLEVYLGDQFLGFAFVDAIIGDTFLGTLEAKIEALDAATFYYKKRKQAKKPGHIGEVWIAKNSGPWKQVNMVAQIIASRIHYPKFFVGKAVTGPLCWAYHLGLQGVVTLASIPIVDPYININSLEKSEPIRIDFVLFGQGDIVYLRGSFKGMFVILDGNPIAPIEVEPVQIKISTKAATVISNRPQELDCYPIGGK